MTNPLGEPPKPADVLELFNAIDDGVVDARVIVSDQFHAKVVLENLTDLPVALNIPSVLAALPIAAQQNVLAQQGFFGQPNGGGQQGFGSTAMSGSSGLPQAVGGTPSSSSSPSSIFSGRGPFNIAPEQVRSFYLPCFCLEYGKPNPRAAVKYELAPLQKANADSRLPGLLAAYARGEIEREAAQAAVWHAANNLSWEEIAAISRPIAINADAPVFNSYQLRNARALIEAVAKQSATTKVATAKKVDSAKKVATVKQTTVVGEESATNASPTKRTGRRDKDRI